MKRQDFQCVISFDMDDFMPFSYIFEPKGADFVFLPVCRFQSAKLNAAIIFPSPEKIKLTLQNHRLNCKQLEQELSKMRSALDKHSEDVDPQFNLRDKATVPKFMKLFWEEQQTCIKASCSSRVIYHPMIYLN